MSTTPIHDRSLPHGAYPLGDGRVRFNLWAPSAGSVTLHLEGQPTAMRQADAAGWWSTVAPGEHGSRYGYQVDDDEVLPDPAARWLPDGVHAPAAVVDPGRWDWRDPRFEAAPITGAVIYELHIGTFTDAGTFGAATQHLRALADLGITHVEVMPVNAFDGHHGWGYDGVAWWAVHQPYGGPDGFAAFVDACHAHGLAVVLDVVHNHLGPSGNYLTRFGPYLQVDAESTWGKVVNLDGPGSDAVRGFLIGNALAWLRDYRVDALRLDAVHALDDRGSAVHVLAELAEAVDGLSEQTGRHLELIAETDRNDPQTIQPRSLGGLGMDAQWADDVHHAVHVAVTGETDGYYVDYDDPVRALATAHEDGLAYTGTHSIFRDRTVGAPLPPQLTSRRLVACAQNHDQVGNRPAGDRLTTLVPPDRVRAAAGLVCLAPHTPMLFMGEEYGETNPFQFFSDMPGAALRQAIRDGRRAEFDYFTSWAGEVPDPLDEATFRRSKLDRGHADTEQGRQRRRLYSDLLALRRREPALGTGDRRLVSTQVDGRVLRIWRRPPRWAADAATVLVTANLGDGSIAGPHGRTVLSTADVAYGGPGTPDAGAVPGWTVVASLLPRSPAPPHPKET